MPRFTFSVIARSACDEAIQLFSRGVMDCFASLAMTGSLPTPPARPEPLSHMRRCRRDHAHRILVPRYRNHDLTRMQMQPRFAEPRPVAVNVVAHNRPPP